MIYPFNRVTQGDSLTLLRQCPANYFHTVVTSVPYWGLRSYLPPDYKEKHYEMGNEPTIQEFVACLVELFAEVNRVLHPSGSLWLNIGDSYAGTGSGQKSTETYPQQRQRPAWAASGLKRKDLAGAPWRLALALQEWGWWLRCDDIWLKPNGLPEPARGRTPRNHEYVFHLTKSANCYWDPEPTRKRTGKEARQEEYQAALGSNKGADADRMGKGYRKTGKSLTHPAGALLRSVWRIPTTQSLLDEHFASFPPELPRRCILMTSSEAGCCRYCGEPWARVIEKGVPDRAAQKACGGDSEGRYTGQTDREMPEGVQNPSDVKRRILEGQRMRHTKGWKSTCNCPKENPIPCRVLDPFAGCGTTLAVAMELGRKALGFDLHPEYVKGANKLLEMVERGQSVTGAAKLNREIDKNEQLTLFGGGA